MTFFIVFSTIAVTFAAASGLAQALIAPSRRPVI